MGAGKALQYNSVNLVLNAGCLGALVDAVAEEFVLVVDTPDARHISLAQRVMQARPGAAIAQLAVTGWRADALPWRACQPISLPAAPAWH
jgi:hypothetical protein